MNGQKNYRAFWLAFLALTVLPLTGCQAGEDFPFYLMETRGDYSEVLQMDGITYERRYHREDEEAYKHYSGSKYRWTTVTEENGQQIGVCGKDANQKPELDIYEVAGDDERIFLYTYPSRFYSGGTDYSLWRQEGVILNEPNLETVSSVSVVCNEEKLFQVDALAMIDAFMEVYNSDTQQVVDIENDGDWQYGSFIMHHKDYSFLQYEIECCCSLEKGTACYRTSAMGEWFSLPDEWGEIISEHVFLTMGE